MSGEQTYSSDVAFTPTVKAIQQRKGSRDTYANVERESAALAERDQRIAELEAELQRLRAAANQTA